MAQRWGGGGGGGYQQYNRGGGGGGRGRGQQQYGQQQQHRGFNNNRSYGHNNNNNNNDLSIFYQNPWAYQERQMGLSSPSQLPWTRLGADHVQKPKDAQQGIDQQVVVVAGGVDVLDEVSSKWLGLMRTFSEGFNVEMPKGDGSNDDERFQMMQELVFFALAQHKIAKKNAKTE